MLAHRFRERAENDAEVAEFLAERCGHRNAVEDRVHRDARQHLLLLKRDPELLERATNFRVYLVEALERWLFLRRRIVANRLIVDRGVVDVWPRRLGHRRPDPVGLEAPLEQPLGLFLLGRDQPDHILAQAFGNRVGLDVGHKAVFVVLIGELFDRLRRCTHVVRRCQCDR